MIFLEDSNKAMDTLWILFDDLILEWVIALNLVIVLIDILLIIEEATSQFKYFPNIIVATAKVGELIYLVLKVSDLWSQHLDLFLQ